MCVLFVAWRHHPEFPLLVAANRDEFYQRPSTPARFWSTVPGLLAGQDLMAGGTWLGATRSGRFAAVTNFREPVETPANARSRGLLPTDFLAHEFTATDFAEHIKAHIYPGFSIFLYDGSDLVYYSNRSGDPRRLEPGLYALSNHLLDTQWPKVSHGKARFAEAVDSGAGTDDLFALLRDQTPVPDDQLPDTGVGRDWERILSPVFVATHDYGTRCATVLQHRADGITEFEERTFFTSRAPPDPSIYQAVRYRFSTSTAR